MNKTRYGTARTVLTVVEWIGWLGLLVALALFVASAQQGLAQGGALIGLAVAAWSLGIIAVAQIGKAQVDTADATRAMLDELRRQSAPAASTAPGSAVPLTAAHAAPPRPAPAPRTTKPAGYRIKAYKGYPITQEADGIGAMGERFDTVLQAEAHINKAIRDGS